MKTLKPFVTKDQSGILSYCPVRSACPIAPLPSRFLPKWPQPMRGKPRRTEPLHPIKVGQLFDRICMDTVGPLPMKVTRTRAYGFIHFNPVGQKNKFFNFIKNKKLIGPHGKYIKFKLSIILTEINIGDIVSYY